MSEDLPLGFERARLTLAEANASLEAVADRLALPRTASAAEAFDILAISGGAAGGAFGAGALVGLTRAGRRPKFAIVTGVSTGALIAPFAFLGPEWDAQLQDAYVGGHAHASFGLAGLSPVLDGGLFRAEALDRLIAPFITEALVDAVSREHEAGRRLLVATTNLDTQQPCIWDMGEIARQGGEEALRMFRLVLAASASLPGIFPPRRFRWERDGLAVEEWHVDGGLAAPLFILPEALLRWRDLGLRLRRGQVYTLFNTVLDPPPQRTPSNLPAILMRSFDIMLRVSYRQALSIALGFCLAHNLTLNVASIAAGSGRDEESMLDFGTENMRAIFDAAAEAAQRQDFWATPATHVDSWGALLDVVKTPITPA
ncbi:MAG: patatin-like phospholipase family protein [Caulobacteraceae bacterium]